MGAHHSFVPVCLSSANKSMHIWKLSAVCELRRPSRAQTIQRWKIKTQISVSVLIWRQAHRSFIKDRLPTNHATEGNGQMCNYKQRAHTAERGGGANKSQWIWDLFRRKLRIHLIDPSDEWRFSRSRLTKFILGANEHPKRANPISFRRLPASDFWGSKSIVIRRSRTEKCCHVHTERASAVGGAISITTLFLFHRIILRQNISRTWWIDLLNMHNVCFFFFPRLWLPPFPSRSALP